MLQVNCSSLSPCEPLSTLPDGRQAARSPPPGLRRRQRALPVPAVVLIQVHDVHALPVEAVVLHFWLAPRYPDLSHAGTVLRLDCKEVWLAPHQPYLPFALPKPPTSCTGTTDSLAPERPPLQRQVKADESPGQGKAFPRPQLDALFLQESRRSYFCFYSSLLAADSALLL